MQQAGGAVERRNRMTLTSAPSLPHSLTPSLTSVIIRQGTRRATMEENRRRWKKEGQRKTLPCLLALPCLLPALASPHLACPLPHLLPCPVCCQPLPHFLIFMRSSAASSAPLPHLPHTLTHSLTHSLLTHSLTHSLTPPHTHSLTHPPTPHSPPHT